MVVRCNKFDPIFFFHQGQSCDSQVFFNLIKSVLHLPCLGGLLPVVTRTVGRWAGSPELRGSPCWVDTSSLLST